MKIYLMHAAHYPLRIKIGISGNPRRRSTYIRKIGRIRIILAVPMLGAAWLELLLKRAFKFAQMPISNVSGGTEFFSILIAPIFALCIVLFFALQVGLGAVAIWLMVR